MARDYAKKRQPAKRSSGAAAKRQEKPATSGWRWYGAGVLSGVFLSFLLYLGTVAPERPGASGQAVVPVAEAEVQPPKPRFDFFTILPEQTIEVEADPEQVARSRTSPEATSSEYYLLQAGSFRNSEDADRRRGELILLGLEPRVEDSTGDNGRWHRVYVGPFDTRSKMTKARSLTAAEDIDTLLVKRGKSH